MCDGEIQGKMERSEVVTKGRSNVTLRYKINQVREKTKERKGFGRNIREISAHHRHLSPFARDILLVAKALGHDVVEGKASPEQDAHFSVLAYVVRDLSWVEVVLWRKSMAREGCGERNEGMLVRYGFNEEEKTYLGPHPGYLVQLQNR